MAVVTNQCYIKYGREVNNNEPTHAGVAASALEYSSPGIQTVIPFNVHSRADWVKKTQKKSDFYCKHRA